MNKILLQVPYCSQIDNKEQPLRTCNSSVHAMLVLKFKPGAIAGDDDYFARFVKPFGESTDHSVHTRALRKLGIESEWRYDLDFKDIDRSLKAGIPMAIGVLHRGFISAPSGGHIILVIGAEYGNAATRNDDVFICHDPFGAGFEYASTNGKEVIYPVIPSLKNRWLADGPGTGWGRIIKAIDGKPTGL